MPLYFGHLVPTLSRGKKPEVAPELVSKGIQLLRASPCDVKIVSIPIARTSFWAIFQAYFSTILYALAATVTPSFYPEDQEIKEKHPNPLPLTLPPLCVSLENQSQTAKDFLHSKGFEQTEIRGSTFFLNNSVTMDLVRELVSSDCPAKMNEKCLSPYRYSNLASLYTALDLITLFSYVSQAMGFSISTNSGLFGDNFNVTENPDTAEEDQEQMDTSEGAKAATPMPKDSKHAIASLFSGGKTLDSFLNKIPYGKVTVSSLMRRVTFSSTQDVAVNAPGNVFRYVSRLAVEDAQTVPNFIQRYLFKNLGSTDLDCASSFLELKSSWGNLRQTDFGLELTHLVKCFEIGMDLGVSVMPLFDSGFYEACLIAGEGYAIVLNNDIVRPLKIVDLVDEIAALSTHDNALRRIETILNTGGADLVDLSGISSMNILRELLISMTLDEKSKDEIVSVADTLRFPTRPWNVNYSSLMSLLEIVNDPLSISNDTPLGPRSLFSLDPIVVGLSCFGEGTCPSFMNPNGTSINLAGSLPRPTQGKSTKESKGKQSTSNAGWTFAVRRVRYDEAVGDLRKMFHESTAKSVSTSIARGLGCVVFSGKQFASLFVKLGEVSASINGSSSLVRPREETGADGAKDNDDKIRSEVGRRAKKVKV